MDPRLSLSPLRQRSAYTRSDAVDSEYSLAAPLPASAYIRKLAREERVRSRSTAAGDRGSEIARYLKRSYSVKQVSSSPPAAGQSRRWDTTRHVHRRGLE